MIRPWMIAAGAALLFVACLAQGQTHNGVQLVQARLIADSETVVPGRPLTLGLHLRMAKGWHTYWEYAGDSGLPTTLDLQLPEGFRATPLQWPLPKRLHEPGDIEVYAYKDEVLLMARVFPPLDIDAKEISIRGRAAWLVCEAICLPGDAELALTLPVGDEIQPANRELFETFTNRLPVPLRGRDGEPVQIEWAREGRALIASVRGPSEWDYDFFPLPPEDVVPGHPEALRAPEGTAARIRIPVTGGTGDLSRLPGVLVATEPGEDRKAWSVIGR